MNLAFHLSSNHLLHIDSLLVCFRLKVILNIQVNLLWDLTLLLTNCTGDITIGDCVENSENQAFKIWYFIIHHTTYCYISSTLTWMVLPMYKRSTHFSKQFINYVNYK